MNTWLTNNIENIIVESDGAVKWKTSGNYLPEDTCKDLKEIGFKFNVEATAIKREKQVHEDLIAYKERMKNYVPTPEEMYEMKAAFGEGATVVNLISGKSITV